jgi:hypothetical protein
MSEDDSPRLGAVNPEIQVTADQHFAILPEELLLDGAITDGAVRLYCVLYRHADRAGVGWPSRARLAKLLRCSTDTIDRRAAELKGAGWLEVEARYDDGGQRSNRYTVRLRSRGDAAGPSGMDAAGPPSTDAAQNESQLELKPENEKTPSRDNDFETWWLGYPKRGGTTRGPKKPARAAWDRLSAADRAAAVRAAPNYAEATDQKFVCDAVRFLSQRRFDEWLEPGRPRGSSWAGPRGRGPEHPLTMEEREAW